MREQRAKNLAQLVVVATLALVSILGGGALLAQENAGRQDNSGRLVTPSDSLSGSLPASDNGSSATNLSTSGVRQTTEYQQAMAVAVRTAAARCLESVVSIEVIGAIGSDEGDVERDAPGSGVVVGKEGYILASSLVSARPSASLIVVLGTGERYAAKVIAKDEHRDLVLLKIDAPNDLKALDLAEASARVVGQTVIAVGRYGGDRSPLVSRGILSAEQRLDGIALQCDARVSPSFYGGPLIDLYGRTLGVLIPAVAEGGAESSTDWYDSGIAFAIPTDVIANKLERMKRGEEIKRGMIGIVARSSDPYSDGTEIAAVRRRSPAEQAGLLPGDEVISVAGLKVRRQLEIRQALGPYDAGETISIGFRRGEITQAVDVTLASTIPPLEPQRLGLILSEQEAVERAKQAGNTAQNGSAEAEQDPTLSPETLANDGSPKEVEAKTKSVSLVIDAIIPTTPADGVFVRGDQLVSVNGALISDIDSLRRLLISANPKDTLAITVIRNGSSVDLQVTTQTIADEALTRYPRGWGGGDVTSQETSELNSDEKKSNQENAEEKNPIALNADVQNRWEVSQWKLPEASNAAAVAAPKDVIETNRLGLLILLMNPGAGAPITALGDWLESAGSSGVVVCAIAPEDQQRWLPKEVDVIARFAASLAKQYSIHPESVAVATAGALAGGDGDAADAMALAVALSQRQLFHGAAVSTKTQPPRIRLLENEGQGSFQLMLSLSPADELPQWAPPLKRAGYPVVTGGEVDRFSLLRWVRLLQVL
jgi:S1-C subfamily serine protease